MSDFTNLIIAHSSKIQKGVDTIIHATFANKTIQQDFAKGQDQLLHLLMGHQQAHQRKGVPNPIQKIPTNPKDGHTSPTPLRESHLQWPLSLLYHYHVYFNISLHIAGCLSLKYPSNMMSVMSTSRYIILNVWLLISDRQKAIV